MEMQEDTGETGDSNMKVEREKQKEIFRTTRMIRYRDDHARRIENEEEIWKEQRGKDMKQWGRETEMKKSKWKKAKEVRGIEMN